jgi:hypothetical protein
MVATMNVRVNIQVAEDSSEVILVAIDHEPTPIPINPAHPAIIITFRLTENVTGNVKSD